jgi:two-component sensor histidine kinase
MTAMGQSSEHIRLLVASPTPQPKLVRAFTRLGHNVDVITPQAVADAVPAGAEAVLIAAPRTTALALSRRLKTRFQVPFLPVVALASRPRRPVHDGAVPDAWVNAKTPPRDVVARVEELVRIRRAERELVRLNSELTELAGENGRLYDRARRDAEATTLLLRELQHRVRNNLAAIQALLSLERHRTPPRDLAEAIDVALSRLRSMAALQDALARDSRQVDLASLVQAIVRNTLDVFGAAETVRYTVSGDATLPPELGNGIAVVINELVTNSLKHAGAHQITIEIRHDTGPLEIVVADDGRGMPAAPAAGSGLTIVRTVVKNELKGELQFLPSETGTRARLLIPER